MLSEELRRQLVAMDGRIEALSSTLGTYLAATEARRVRNLKRSSNLKAFRNILKTS